MSFPTSSMWGTNSCLHVCVLLATIYPALPPQSITFFFTGLALKYHQETRTAYSTESSSVLSLGFCM